jgi:hypothetical protein
MAPAGSSMRATAIGDTGRSIGAAWADYDRDGDLDLYVANEGGPNHLFRNDQSLRHHWLHVDLVGEWSNRSGIGARVRVVTGTRAQTREVSGGSGYLSQSATAEFTSRQLCCRYGSGLGRAGLSRRWQVAADQRIAIPRRHHRHRRRTEAIRRALTVHPATPNPFNPITTIRYDLPERAAIELRVFDLSGRAIRTLVPPGVAGPGRYTARWDGRDEAGRSLESGVYFYRLRAGSQRSRRWCDK